MAQAPRTRIDQLPAADSITDADVMPIQQAGQTRRASAAQMMMYATKAVPTGSPGTAGTAGRDGRGVAAASIASNGKLYVSYTDGSVQDAGDVTGTNVVVGNGPPAMQSANLGDIYLDAVSGDLYTMEA